MSASEQPTPDPPPGDAGERAEADADARLVDLLRRRADVYSPQRNSKPYYGDDDIDLLRCMIDEGAALLYKTELRLLEALRERTAAASQARRETIEDVAKHFHNKGETSMAFAIRALANPQESA